MTPKRLIVLSLVVSRGKSKAEKAHIANLPHRLALKKQRPIFSDLMV
jgi:hypothetical protein